MMLKKLKTLVRRMVTWLRVVPLIAVFASPRRRRASASAAVRPITGAGSSWTSIVSGLSPVA
jgi:hypothetical protein